MKSKSYKKSTVKKISRTKARKLKGGSSKKYRGNTSATSTCILKPRN